MKTTNVTTVVATKKNGVKRRTWDYECSAQRRAFGGLASRTVREGGVVVSIGEGAAVSHEDVEAWLSRRIEFGIQEYSLGLITELANEVLRTGGTLREDVQETNQPREL